MAELQPGDLQQINGDFPPPPPASTSAEALSITAAGSKRLRRRSVRLAAVGDEQYHYHHDGALESQGQKSKWASTSNRKDKSKSSRTRTLTNSSCGYENNGSPVEEREGNVDLLGIGSWRVKKRVRFNWVSKGGEMDNGDDEEELEGGFRDFSREDSESPIKEEPFDRNGGVQGRRKYESNNGNGKRDLELTEPWNMDGVGSEGGREGVKIWLEELGLGRYWPMFEMHEVDEEVLPLLTLDDLKDMGINTVGTRRKMFCAIQKLGMEFS